MGAAPSGPSPLQGRRIVITRPEEKARGLAERLRALGAVPIVFPTVRIEPADQGPLVAAARALDAFDWVAFSSAHGVAAFAGAMAAAGRPVGDLGAGARRVAAVGPVTAAALRERGVEPALVPPVYVAEAVLEALGDVRGLSFLLPRADIGRDALAAGLAARGARVTEVVAYRTVAAAGVAPPAGLAEADAVTFTSASTVRHFVAAVGAGPAGAKVVCIGPVTAEAARALGLAVDAVAEPHTEDGLIRALEGVLST